MNICSPFGLNSKELFLNIQYKGIVSNVLGNALYLTDLDGSLVNVEGSPVFNKHDGSLVGIRLPNLHSQYLFMNAAVFTPLHNLISQLSNEKKDSTQQKSPKSLSQIVVRIKDGNLW